MMQLLLVIEEWVDILDEDYTLDMIYLDIGKAYRIYHGLYIDSESIPYYFKYLEYSYLNINI